MKHKVKHVHFVGMRRIGVSPEAGAPLGMRRGESTKSRRYDVPGGCA
jgi:hypothetical protein